MNRALLEEAQRIVRERDDLGLSLRNLHGELDTIKMELREKQVEALRFKEQAEEFREIFLAEAGNQTVSDDEVIQSFVKMRQRALSLTKHKALCFDGVHALKIQGNAPWYLKDFYSNGAWDSWKPKDRELHVRRIIFEILSHFILDITCFGIEGFSLKQNETLGRIAQGLSYLEVTAKNKNCEYKTNQKCCDPKFSITRANFHLN